jgi:hypothetical protein
LAIFSEAANDCDDNWPGFVKTWSELCWFKVVLKLVAQAQAASVTVGDLEVVGKVILTTI